METCDKIYDVTNASSLPPFQLEHSNNYNRYRCFNLPHHHVLQQVINVVICLAELLRYRYLLHTVPFRSGQEPRHEKEALRPPTATEQSVPISWYVKHANGSRFHVKGWYYAYDPVDSSKQEQDRK